MTDNLQEYIENCIKSGITSMPEIINQIKNEIGELDSELKILENKRIDQRSRQNALKLMLKQLGSEDKKPKIVSIMNSSVDFSELDSIIQDMCKKICTYLDKVNKPVTNRQIMSEISSLEEHKIVLLAIKWLWEQGIITKDENSITREILRGHNWEKRPV